MKAYPSVIIIVSLAVLLTPAVSGQTLVSLDNSFTEAWNNGNVALPAPGTLTIPKGPGILTTTIVQEPFYKSGLPEGPQQVKYLNLGSTEGNTDIGLLLGDSFYQKGEVIGTVKRVSDGLPLTKVSRYYTNLDLEKPLSVQIIPAIVMNTNHQLANRVRYSASWEPLEAGRAHNPGCDVSGTWKTNWGNIILSDKISTDQQVHITGAYTKEEQGTFDGILSGPVLTGVWSEPEVKTGEDSGRFTFSFRNNCCAFTGTWGTGESDSNGGEWSGVRN